MTSRTFFERGGFNLGKLSGVPVRLHWTALLGAFVFTGFRFDAVAWACFFGLVLVHELGHALTVKTVGARPVLIELTGYGGLCHWQGSASAIGRAAIAWGGVWAQLLVLFAALGYLYALGMPRDGALARVLWAMTHTNAWLIAVNLVPIAPLDGREAWRLPVLLGRSLRGRPVEPTVMPDEVKDTVASLLEEARRS